MPTLEELAEDTAVHLLPRLGFDMLDRGTFVFEIGAHRASVQRIRLGDVESAVAWTREECRHRGIDRLEWWIGWSATPADLAGRLSALGLEPDDEEAVLTGMTCSVEPPTAPDIEVREIETLEQQLEALAVDWDVWGMSTEDRDKRRAWEEERFELIQASGVVRHFAAAIDDRVVGFGRAIDMDGGVAMMGGVVLPAYRGRGVYRALVHRRWRHAVERGTPLLVVQAGHMSRPILEDLGFVRHGDLRLYADTL